MPHVGQQLASRRANIDRLAGNIEAFAQRNRVRLRVIGRCETGHRVGQDVRSRPTQHIHCARRDDQSMRGIEATGNTNNDLRITDRLEALNQTMNLNIVGLVAVLSQALRIVGNERETINGAFQTKIRAGWVQLGVDVHRSGCLQPLILAQVAIRVVFKRILARTFSDKTINVHVSDRDLTTAGFETLTLCQQVAGLVHHRLAVP